MPKDLSDEKLENKNVFETELFNAVQSLFDNNTWLSEEFDKRDVAIGHSYFITNADPEKGVSREMRIKYEIRPLLEEYVKDGVLKRDYDGKRIQEKLDEIFNLA